MNNRTTPKKPTRGEAMAQVTDALDGAVEIAAGHRLKLIEAGMSEEFAQAAAQDIYSTLIKVTKNGLLKGAIE